MGVPNDLKICFRGDFGMPSSNLRSKTSKSFTQRPKFRNQNFRKLKILMKWRRVPKRTDHMKTDAVIVINTDSSLKGVSHGKSASVECPSNKN